MTDDRGPLGARPRSTTAAPRAVRARADRRAAGFALSKGRLLLLPVEQFAESLLKRAAHGRRHAHTTRAAARRG